MAYNTDSKIINTVRSNGILLANIVPQGGTISGSSSVMQLDAWNWEDAIYAGDNGIHLNMPSFINRFGRRGGGGGIPPALLAQLGLGGGAGGADPAKAALDKVEEIKSSPLKAAPNGFEPTSPEARAAIEAIVLDSYAWFKGLVKDRRKMDDTQLTQVSDGRVFTGRQAVGLRLVDGLGNAPEAFIGLLQGKNFGKLVVRVASQ